MRSLRPILLAIAVLLIIPCAVPRSVVGQDQPLGNPVRNYPVPYIHQVYDTPTSNSFNGYNACGPTSATMAAAYYHKIAPHPITVNSPTPHTSNYGNYVPAMFAYTNPGGGGAYPFKIAEYLWNTYRLDSEYKTSPTLDAIKQALNQGYVVVLGTYILGGHILLVRGYTDDGGIIVNDPFGDWRRQPYPNTFGENVTYAWSQLPIGSWMLIVKGVADTDDNRGLIVNQTLGGTISPNNDEDTYFFSGTAGSTIRLTMNQTGTTLDSYLELYGPSGRISYNDDSNGSRNSQIDVTLPSSATYRVVAHTYQYSSSGGYQITLNASSEGDDNRWLAVGSSLHGTITPNNDRDTYYIRGSIGTLVSIRMNRDAAPLDSYLEVYDPSGTKVGYNDDGGGDRNSWLPLRFNSNGDYRIMARSYNSESSGGYTISVGSLRGQNYALGRVPIVSSEQSASYPARYATDGNRGTRWSSGISPYQRFTIDFGQARQINQVVIRWETAYATGYDLYYRNGDSWVALYGTNSSNGDIDVMNFSPVTTRYIMLWMRGRDARWSNYSLWEVEAYDSDSVLAPLIPPDDPDKPEETTVTPLIPLAPDPDDKNPPLLGAAGDQEVVPLLDLSETVDPPFVPLDASYGPPTATLTLSAISVLEGDLVTALTLDAHDTDSFQTGSGIAGYRWSLAPANVAPPGGAVLPLGDQEHATITTAGLAPGSYIVALEIQDDEGQWSEPITAMLEVRQRYRIYLPTSIR